LVLFEYRGKTKTLKELKLYIEREISAKSDFPHSVVSHFGMSSRNIVEVENKHTENAVILMALDVDMNEMFMPHHSGEIQH
jgi:hypothetical protein